MRKNYSTSLINRVNFKQLFIPFFFTVFAFISTNNSLAQTCSLNAGEQLLQYCSNEVISIGVGGSATTTTASTLWTQLSGPSVVIDDPTSVSTTITGALPGTYRFELSGVCDAGDLSGVQEVELIIFPITVSDAGPDISSCPGTFALAGNTPAAGESGTWTYVSGDQSAFTITSPNSPSSTVVFGETAGTATYAWVIENQFNNAPNLGFTDCTFTDTVTLTNFGGDPMVSAGADRTLSECYTSTTGVRLLGTEGGAGLGGQNGSWTFVSTTASSLPTGLPSTNNEPNVANLTEGEYVFRYTVTGPCAVGEDTVTITVPKATQDISRARTSNQNFCTGVTSTVLQGNIPLYAGETVEWKQTAGPATPESAAVGGNGNVFATTPTTTVSLNGSSAYNFTYQIKGDPAKNPSCESNIATSRIRYFNQPNTITLNGGNTVVVLPADTTQGSVPIARTGGNSLTASLVSGPLAASAINFSANRAQNIFTFEDLTESGTYIFRVNNRTTGRQLTGCTDSSETLTVVVSLSTNRPNPGTGLVFDCGLTSGSLSGNAPTQGTASWSQVGGPVTATLTPSPANPDTNVDI